MLHASAQARISHRQLPRFLLPSSAGFPNNDQVYFCPATGGSCYVYVSTRQTYNASKAYCQYRGGYLVAYNTGGGMAGGTPCLARYLKDTIFPYKYYLF